MTMSKIQTPNFLYDLSNPHFEETEIITTDNKSLKGQFVQFKVVKGEFENLYPAEKYCFLPHKNRKLFEEEYSKNNGEFNEFPAYVIQFTMDKIKQINTKPVLIPGCINDP
jgi:hypothetical protein